MAADLQARLIDATFEVMSANTDLLTRLDQAIGDGDHGLNMKRGFSAIAEARDELARVPLSEALNKAGMLLVMKVGGASGPLYGSLLMAMGKAAGGGALDAARAALMLEEGVVAVKKRGKSEPGEKTMLEVLVPVRTALAEGVALPLGGLLERLRAAAFRGLQASKPLKATKGRASFLGERSIGHLDPGAQSSCLLVHAVCDVLQNLEPKP